MSNWELVGYVSVDSGQLLITDPCYLKEFNNDNCKDRAEPSYSYSGCCGATSNKEGCGQTPNGNFTECGFALSNCIGDGSYPVYVKRDSDNGITAVKIDFLKAVYEA